MARTARPTGNTGCESSPSPGRWEGDGRGDRGIRVNLEPWGGLFPAGLGQFFEENSPLPGGNEALPTPTLTRMPPGPLSRHPPAGRERGSLELSRRVW